MGETVQAEGRRKTPPEGPWDLDAVPLGCRDENAPAAKLAPQEHREEGQGGQVDWTPMDKITRL